MCVVRLNSCIQCSYLTCNYFGSLWNINFDTAKLHVWSLLVIRCTIMLMRWLENFLCTNNYCVYVRKGVCTPALFVHVLQFYNLFMRWSNIIHDVYSAAVQYWGMCTHKVCMCVLYGCVHVWVDCRRHSLKSVEHLKPWSIL